MATNESTLVPTKELVGTKIISKFQTTRFYAPSATPLEVPQIGVKNLFALIFMLIAPLLLNCPTHLSLGCHYNSYWITPSFVMSL